MYETVFWWATIFGSLQAGAIAVCVFSGIVSLVLLIAWGFAKSTADIDREDEAREKTFRPWMIRATVIFIITLFFAIVLPGRDTVITYAAVRAIDKHNATVATSQLTPDAALTTVDNAVQAINNIFKAAEKLSK